MRHRATAILAGVLLCFPATQFIFAQADTSQIDAKISRLSALLPNLSETEITVLLAAGEASLRYELDAEDTPVLRLAPAFSQAIRSDLEGLSPKIGVEVLFLVDSRGIERIDEELLTILHSISTMEGIEYYSASRERMRTLFHESYVVNDPAEKERVPDPVVAGFVSSNRIYVYQRDSSFGRNTLELTYTAESEAVRLRMRNLTPMLYQGILPAVGREQLQLDLVIYSLGEELLFYGNAAARPVTLMGMQERVQRSFYNRLVALYHWFRDQTG